MVNNDFEHKILINKFCDLIERVEKYHSIEFTDFVNPDLLGYFFDVLKNHRDIRYSLFGDEENLEYKMLAVYPDYMEHIEKEKFPVKVITYYGNKEIGNLAHRDVFGAIMSLGITRNKFGDILFFEDTIKVIIRDELSDYVKTNLEKIGKYNLESSISGINEFDKIEIKYMDLAVTVKSLRIDSLISSAFNLSRSKSMELIRSEKVRANYRIINSPSKLMVIKDMISVRGMGRFLIDDIGDLTKKDRIRVTLKKYI